MDTSALAKISSDAHVDEPHDLWYERLDESLRDTAPRRIQSNESGGWSLVIDGSQIGWTGMSAEEAEQQEKERLAAAAPEVRLDMMRTDGLNGEIIYPTIGLYAYNLSDPRVGEASCRVYNDWIRERLAGNPRIKLAGMIPTWSLEMATAEIERLAGDDSIGGLLLPLVGTPEWNLPHWEPLWEVLAHAGKPVVMHQGTGHDMIFYRGWGSPTANLLATQSLAPRAAGLLACSGVLERYPDLHFVFVEVNAGWMAWANSTLDEYYEAHQMWTKPKLKEMPSHYVKRQIHATFQNDPVAIANIPFTGTDSLLWGNDFPHPESTFPNSDKVLSELFRDVDESDAYAIAAGNAARLFGFDQVVTETRP